LKKLGNINNEDIQREILYDLSQYTKGNFASYVDFQGLSYMTFFKAKTYNQTFVSCVHVERVPEFSSQNKVDSLL